MKVKEFFGKFVSKYLLLHLLAMAIVIVALCISIKIGLEIYTHHGEGTELPDLTGTDLKKAIALLDQHGLLISITDSGYNKKMPVNCILTQQPSAGTTVKEGRTIFVTINSATLPSVKIPDIIDNSSYREAQARLTSLGFKMLEPSRIEGERDWVYGITYRGRSLQTGEMVPKESELSLVVGNGYDEDEEEGEMMLDAPDPIPGEETDDFEEVTAP